MRENVRNNFWKKILKPLIKDRTDKIELTEKDKLEIGELNPGWILNIFNSQLDPCVGYNLYRIN